MRSLSIEEEKEKQAEEIQKWYESTWRSLRVTLRQAFLEKDIDYPDYFPGRHWLSNLERFWMQLFPDSDSLTYHQVCADMLTVLNNDLVFADKKASEIEQLQLYLIDNYENVHNALSRLAGNLGKHAEIFSRTGIYKMKEALEEDGSQLYYQMGKPYCLLLGGQEETEQQKRWRKFVVLIAHWPWPFPLDPSIATSLQVIIIKYICSEVVVTMSDYKCSLLHLDDFRN